MNLKTLTIPLALAGAVLAQEQNGGQSSAQATESPFAVPTLTEFGGNLWASGRAYEASFENGRMQYIPVLGDRAPTTQSFTFTFESARRGEVVVTDGQTREATANGLTASIRRPNGIEEQYAVRREGLKQSFVFGQELGSNGDLVVRGRLETPLPFQGATAEGGLSFVHPTFGGVELGKVVGFDANGDEVTGSMSFDGESLEMTLPASFVDTAAWPITLDPLVGTVLDVNSDTFFALNPDASTNAAGEVLMVFTRQFSLTSSAVRAQRLNADGTNNSGVFGITVSTTEYATNPAVGYNRDTNNWLVVWESRANGPFDQSDIRSLGVQPDGTRTAIFDIAATPANEVTPDVASDGRGTDNECMIVYAEEGAGIRARETAPNSTGVTAFSIRNVTSNANDRNPSISQNSGQSTVCLIAFERGNDVFATRITINGSFQSTQVLVASNASNPDCDGDGEFGMVVYQTPESGNPNSHDIFARCFDINPSVVATGPAAGVDVNINSDEIEPSIAFLGPNALVVWSDQLQPSPFNYDIASTTLDLNLCTRCSNFSFQGSSFSGRQHRSVATSRLAANPAAGSQTGMFFWLEQDGTNGFNGDIAGRRFTATGSGGSRSTIAPGCGLGGSLSAPSAPTLGEDLVLNVTGADPGSLAGFLLLREPNTALFNCGICSAVIPAISLTANNLSGGNYSFTIPVPCDISLNGGRFDWQGAVLGTPQTPCLFGPGVGFSNVYRTTLGL